MPSCKFLKYESVSAKIAQPIVNPSPQAWTTSDFGGGARSWLPHTGSGRQPDLFRAQAKTELASPKRRARASDRNASTGKLPVLTSDARLPMRKGTPSCYPDLTHLSRSQQLIRRWESLPSFGSNNLTEEDLDAIRVAVGGSCADSRLSSSPVEQDSESDGRKFSKRRNKPSTSEKHWPFIPCSCCHSEQESALDRVHSISLSARSHSS